MQLTLDQTRELRELILLFLPTKEELRDFLRDEAGGRELDHYALGTDLQIVVSELIANARTGQPPFVAEIVAGIGRRFAHDARVSAFIAATTPAAPRADRTVAPPYYACFAESRPFVNRGQLRPALERLHAPKPRALKKPRILVVAGNRKTGKTYTKYLILHLGAQFGFDVRVIDLWAGDTTPAGVARRIADQMKLEGIQQGTEQATRFVTTFFDHLAGQVHKSAWWLVLDGFEQISVSHDLTEFINDLATKVDDSLPNMRLVLLGYKSQLPNSVARIVETDATADISKTELVQFFEQFYAEYGPPLDAAARKTRIAQHVDTLCTKMDAADAEARFEIMEAELTAICDQIASA